MCSSLGSSWQASTDSIMLPALQSTGIVSQKVYGPKFTAADFGFREQVCRTWKGADTQMRLLLQARHIQLPAAAELCQPDSFGSAWL